MTTTVYTIRELCVEFGVPPRTLRFYEYKELLAPQREGQRRLFTQRDRARLKVILRCKRFGFALDELKDLLELYDTDPNQVTQLTAVLKAARQHHGELVADHKTLTAALTDLENHMGEVHRILEERRRIAA